MKVCKHCGATSRQVEFAPRRNACRECYLHHHREWMKTRRTMGKISANARCNICGSKKNLVIDHCHDSQVIRGVLCNSCNVALGYMSDDPARLRKAAAYLEGEDYGEEA